MSCVEQVRYDREVLTTVLVYHQRASVQFCACGWGELGKSHADHVANVYEQSVGAVATTSSENKEPA